MRPPHTQSRICFHIYDTYQDNHNFLSLTELTNYITMERSACYQQDNADRQQGTPPSMLAYSQGGLCFSLDSIPTFSEGQCEYSSAGPTRSRSIQVLNLKSHPGDHSNQQPYPWMCLSFTKGIVFLFFYFFPSDWLEDRDNIRHLLIIESNEMVWCHAYDSLILIATCETMFSWACVLWFFSMKP